MRAYITLNGHKYFEEQYVVAIEDENAAERARLDWVMMRANEGQPEGHRLTRERIDEEMKRG